MSPEPPNASVGVGGSGLISTSGMTSERCASLCQPGAIVIVAGFQNIEDRRPEPDATPAKDRPCAVALCSRTREAAGLRRPCRRCKRPRADTAAKAQNAKKKLMQVPALWNSWCCARQRPAVKSLCRCCNFGRNRLTGFALHRPVARSSSCALDAMITAATAETFAGDLLRAPIGSLVNHRNSGRSTCLLRALCGGQAPAFPGSLVTLAQQL